MRYIFTAVRLFFITLTFFAGAAASFAQDSTYNEYQNIGSDMFGRQEARYVVEITNVDSIVIICRISWKFTRAVDGQGRIESVNQAIYPGRMQPMTLTGFIPGSVSWEYNCRY